MKSYTDLEQSKKLAEILPIESADMWWVALNWQETEYYVEIKQDGINQPKKAIPCWSLTALLDTLDDIVVDDEGNEYSLKISKEEGMYYIYYRDRWEEVNDIETDCYYDLVDACYEMISKLHEQKML